MNAAGWTISIIAIGIVVVLALRWGTSARERPIRTAADSAAELRRLVDDLQAHQADVDRLLALHDDDAVIVNFGGRRVYGTADLRQAMQAALASPLADVTTSAEVHDIRYVRPDVAIISCTKHVDDRRADGTPFASRGSLTYVAALDGGGWRVVLAQTTPIAAA